MALEAFPEPTFTPSTNWQEKPREEEKEAREAEKKLFEDFAKKILEYQVKDSMPDKRLRGFHAKIQTGFEGEFEVLPDLPAYARQGVFKKPKRFPAVVRFSNGESRFFPDNNAEPRGIAIKLLDVDGPAALQEQGNAITQDFLATSHSVTAAVKDVTQFMAFVKAHRHKNSVVFFFALLFRLGFRETLRILLFLKRTVRDVKVRSMATEHYSGTAPIKFGPYAVKFTIRPVETGIAPPAKPGATVDFLRKELIDRLRKSDLVLDFLIQFYVDDIATPIEDTSVPWLPENSPPLRVAQLRIPSFDLDLLEEKQKPTLTERVDSLSFSPWHALEDHRPLGNVMRARRVAYEASANGRRGHQPEPSKLPL